MSNILNKGETGFGILIERDAGHLVPELNKKLINENFTVPDNDEPILINCILQKYGVKNKNGRIYPKDILIPQINAFQQLIDINSAVNEADHPDTASVSLQNISHLIKKMWWGDGENAHVLYGQLEIITSPAYRKQGIVSMIGDKIMEYLKRGVQLGISSRGVGTLKEINGENIVQDDFELICFDLVASPSTPGAYLFPNKNQLSVGESIINTKNTINEDNKKIINILDEFLLS